MLPFPHARIPSLIADSRREGGLAVADTIKSGLFELQELTFFGGRVMRLPSSPLLRPRHLRGDGRPRRRLRGRGLLAGIFAGEAMALQIVKARRLRCAGAYRQGDGPGGRSRPRAGADRLIVSGRVASSIAAELGGMVLGKQVVAIEVYGEDPIQKLVVPRVLSLAIMVPSSPSHRTPSRSWGATDRPLHRELEPAVYWNGVRENLTLETLVIGTVKPMVFGIVIGIVACYVGLQTTGGTKGVAMATRKAVVWNSIAILMVNLLITQLGFRFLRQIFG